jgi:hypothetical protein
MSTNVNTTAVKPPDKVDHSYQGNVVKPLPPGNEEYLLQTTKVEIGSTKDGYLMGIIDAKVIAPGKPFDGVETRFNRVTTKNWPSKPINGATEYLRSAGMKTTPQDNPGYTAALKSTVGKTFKAVLDWEAFNQEHSVSLKGMDAFPLNTKQADGTLLAPRMAEGVRVPFVTVASKSEAGKTEKVYANTRIRFYRSPSAT